MTEDQAFRPLPAAGGTASSSDVARTTGCVSVRFGADVGPAAAAEMSMSSNRKVLSAACTAPSRTKHPPAAVMIIGADVGRTIATTRAMSGHHNKVRTGAGMIHWLDSGGIPARTQPGIGATHAGRYLASHRTLRPASASTRERTGGRVIPPSTTAP